MDLKCTCGFGFHDGPKSMRHLPGCPIGDWISGKTQLLTELTEIDVLAAEQLAKLFHEMYERLAPQFGYKTRDDSAAGWEKVPEINRTVMLATCEEVLRKLDQDPGEKLAMLVSKQGERIRVDFQQRLRWFAFDKDHAVNFALTILQHCGVPVQITLNPPPANSEKPV